MKIWGCIALGEKERKVRSDKKILVSPFVDVKLYNCVSNLSYVTNQSVKQVGEDLCRKGFSSKKVVDQLATHFVQEFRWGTAHLFGPMDPVPVPRFKRIEKKRLQMRFSQVFDNRLIDLAYAMRTQKATSAGLLLTYSVLDRDTVAKALQQYVQDDLDPQREKVLNEVVKFINRYNPYNESTSILVILARMVKQLIG